MRKRNEEKPMSIIDFAQELKKTKPKTIWSNKEFSKCFIWCSGGT